MEQLRLGLLLRLVVVVVVVDVEVEHLGEHAHRRERLRVVDGLARLSTRVDLLAAVDQLLHQVLDVLCAALQPLAALPQPHRRAPPLLAVQVVVKVLHEHVDEPLELVARLHRLSKQLHEVHHLLLRVRRLALGFGLREVRLCQLGVARALEFHRDQPLVGHDRQHVVEHLRCGVRRGVRRGVGRGVRCGVGRGQHLRR